MKFSGKRREKKEKRRLCKLDFAFFEKDLFWIWFQIKRRNLQLQPELRLVFWSSKNCAEVAGHLARRLHVCNPQHHQRHQQHEEVLHFSEGVAVGLFELQRGKRIKRKRIEVLARKGRRLEFKSTRNLQNGESSRNGKPKPARNLGCMRTPFPRKLPLKARDHREKRKKTKNKTNLEKENSKKEEFSANYLRSSLRRSGRLALGVLRTADLAQPTKDQLVLRKQKR